MADSIRMAFVPVELLERMKEQLWEKPVRSDVTLVRKMIDDALTAAPVREEGGADLTPLADDPAVAALCDSNYRAGALAGWNAANHSDTAEGERIMARIRRVESGALAPIVERHRLRALATRHEAPAEAGEDDGLFLLMKRGLYYRPNAMGHTGIKDKAGRYTEDEAAAHADESSGVTVVRASEAPDFSPACLDDLARQHLAKKLDEARREIATLRAQPQAREEARPVAWVDPHVLQRLAENLGGRIYPRQGRGARQPLYTTPPAPEAEKLLNALRDHSWDLRCFNIQTGGDDCDIGWRVIGHWQAEPCERTVAEVFSDDPAEAVRLALAALQAEQKGGAV